MTSFVSPEGDGVRILALDGGDVRCISQLVMLEEFMHRLEHDLKRPVRPCEYFHLITGVGAAGVIAILLGVLGMTVADARDAFATICQDVFRAGECTESMRSQELERAMKELLSRLQVPDESRLEGDLDRSAGCRVSICYASALNMSTCRMFRSYTSARSSYNPTILEAVRASWATPGVFSSIHLGANLMQEEIISAVNGFNNPTLETIKEAQDIFGKERRVSCLLSLGAGQTEVRSTSSKDYTTKTAQDTETIARESQRRFGSLGIYFRFSVERGMDLECAIKDGTFGAIATHTTVYLEGDDNAKRLDRFVTISGSTDRVTLDNLSRVQNRRTRASHALPPLSAFLVAREEPMRAIVAALSRTESTGQLRAVVTGMSGCGKTQISLKYAYDHDNVYDHILFVDASSIESIQAGIMTRVRALDYQLNPKTPREALNLLAHPTGDISENWLIIMDNADNTQFDIRDFFPPTSDHGAILITSRNPALGNLSSLGHVPLDVMSVDEAVEALLCAAFGPLAQGVDRDTKADLAPGFKAMSSTKTDTTPVTSRSDSDRRLAVEIVTALGFLPIAVIQAACYIKMQKCLSDYYKRLMRSRSKLLRWPASVQSDKLKYSHSTYAAFDTTISVLSARSLQILGILSFFHFTNFPRPLVALAASLGFAYERYDLLERTAEYQDSIELLKTVLCPDGEWDEFEFDLVLEELQQYSLVTLVPVHSIVTLRFHPLLHAWSRDRLSPQERSSLGAAAIRLLVCGANPDDGYMWQYLTPHVNLLSLTSEDLHVNDRGALAMVLRSEGGQADKLVTIWQNIHAKVERIYGEKHVRTIRAASLLADAYGEQGDVRQMERMERDLLEVCRLTLGNKHLETVRLMGNLANTWMESAERLPEAERLSKEVLCIHRDILGPNHREIVVDLRRLATVYMIRQEYLEGASLLVNALSVITTIVGRAHVATIQTMEQLAQCHIGSGRKTEGVLLRREAMDLWRVVHGDRHVTTLAAMASLAATYHFQAQYVEAEKLWRDVAEGRRGLFGDHDENFLSALTYLARAIFYQERYADAEDVYKEALVGCRALHGEHHAVTLDILYWYALSIYWQNRFATAETLWREELEGRRKIHGEHHADTQSALYWVAQALYVQGFLEESESLWRQHLATQRTMDQARLTISSLRGLSHVLFAQEKYHEVEELEREELEARRQLDGDIAPGTMEALFMLAACVYRQGRYEEAGDLWKEELRRRREVHGDDHPDTLEAQHWLGLALYEQEKYDEAHALWTDEVKIRRVVDGDDDEGTLRAVELLEKVTAKQREKSEAYPVQESQREYPEPAHFHQVDETLAPPAPLAV